jgi:hypothetical protein
MIGSITGDSLPRTGKAYGDRMVHQAYGENRAYCTRTQGQVNRPAAGQRNSLSDGLMNSAHSWRSSPNLNHTSWEQNMTSTLQHQRHQSPDNRHQRHQSPDNRRSCYFPSENMTGFEQTSRSKSPVYRHGQQFCQRLNCPAEAIPGEDAWRGEAANRRGQQFCQTLNCPADSSPGEEDAWRGEAANRHSPSGQSVRSQDSGFADSVEAAGGSGQLIATTCDKEGRRPAASQQITASQHNTLSEENRFVCNFFR